MFGGTFLIHKYYNNIIHTCLINSMLHELEVEQ
jgi:hypothetical protein